MNKRKVGNYGEDLACEYLTKNGLIILDRNYTTKHGEIDIVAKDGETIVFAEVKYRRDTSEYNPLYAVTKSKIKHLIYSARVYLYLNNYSENTPVRFDCIGITGEQIEWIKSAFEAI